MGVYISVLQNVGPFYFQGKTSQTMSESQGSDVTSDVSSRLDNVSLSDEKTTPSTDGGPSQSVETKPTEGDDCVGRDSVTREEEAEGCDGDKVEQTDVTQVKIVSKDAVEKHDDSPTDGATGELRGQLGEGDVLPAESLREGESDDEDEDDDSGVDDDDGDDDGWITPSNICSVKQSMGEYEAICEERVDVGCLTTDFAMQVSRCGCGCSSYRSSLLLTLG